jgi:ribosomal protein S21
MKQTGVFQGDGMPGSGDALWEINNEYRKQLTLLMSHMKLLEELLKVQGRAEPGLRAAIRRFRAALEEIDADQHEWRHRYFYMKPAGEDRRRMVSDPAAIELALQTFRQMFAGHAQQYALIAQTFAGLARPDPALTRVIKGGDLWLMCQEEVAELAGYGRFIQAQLSGQLFS